MRDVPPAAPAALPRMTAGLAAVAGLLAVPAIAWAADGSAPAQSPQKIFMLLFLMLGPIKILGPFVGMTGAAEPKFRWRLATRAILFAAAGLGAAVVLGPNMLENFDVPVPILALTAGLILFLVALQTVLQQFDDQPARRSYPAPTLALAVNPLAFPTIVTPYGIAAVIIFITLARNDVGRELTIAGVVAGILAMDWIAMLFAHTILKYVGTPLQILGVVLGINQVALGLMVILQSLSNLGVFVWHAP